MYLFNLTMVGDEQFERNIPLNVPAPFRKALFWPENKASTSTSRKREKIPAVASSASFQEYFQKKQQQKDSLEKEKADRKKKREENKKIKLTMLERKSESKSSYRNDESSSSDESSNNDHLPEPNHPSKSDKFIVGSHVIVKYEEELFPGLILDKKKEEVKVKVMAMSGISTWKWPKNDDILWYPNSDIVKSIKKPVLVNKRGIYKVTEMNTHSSYKC